MKCTALTLVSLATVATAGATQAALIPYTFEVNDSAGSLVSNSQNFGDTAVFTLGTGADALQMTLTVPTGNSIQERGGGLTSGLAVAPDVGTQINDDEVITISFQDADTGTPVAVDILSIEFAALNSAESAIFTPPGGAIVIAGVAGNDNAFSFDFIPDAAVGAGQSATLEASPDDAFRLHSITVQEIPEPGTVAIAALGASAVLLRRRGNG